MSKPESLSGTGNAPLAATRRYSFRRVVGSAGDAHLVIPVVHRTSCEDLGEVAHSEQEVFVAGLLDELEVPHSAGFPGEWVFPDVATLDRVWSALGERLREPEKTVPRFDAHGEIVNTTALTSRFLELVRRVGFVREREVDARVVVVDSETGERWELSSSLGDGRDVQATARVDNDSHGTVDVTVSGVLDGQVLADQFLASLRL